MNLSALFEKAADGVCGIDGAGRIALWNRAAERILDYPAREVLGKRCCDLFGGDGAQAGACLDACLDGCGVMARPGPRQLVERFEIVCRTRTGRPIQLEMGVVALAGDPAEPSTTVHVFRSSPTTRAPGPSAWPARMAPVAANDHLLRHLTRREAEILRQLMDGVNTRVMADRLGVSRATVRNHVKSVLRKLQVHSRLEAVALASRRKAL